MHARLPELETVGDFMVWVVAEPEAVGNFIMGVHKAQDVPQFSGVDCSKSANNLRLSANSRVGVLTASDCLKLMHARLPSVPRQGGP